jgi:hypothetical protein
MNFRNNDAFYQLKHSLTAIYLNLNLSVMITANAYGAKAQQAQTKVAQPVWQRVILLCVLGYEAAGCLMGGSLLVAAPDGRLMDMPASMMNGVFPDFLVPGLILFGLGILNAAAFILVLRKSQYDWVWAGMATGGLLIWFWVEIAILQSLHWQHAMWGLPVILGVVMAIPLIPSWRTALTDAFLFCGILSSLLYAAINIIVPLQWQAYDIASQTVSELSAVGAPTRTLWLVLCTPYTLLMIAFGWGVWKSARENRPLRIAGILLIIYAALGIIWPFAPMHLRETLAAGGATFSDTLHIALGAVTEVLFLLALGFSAAAFGLWFRVYSIATFAVLLIFGVLTFIGAPGVGTNQPTPLLGIWERINIGVFLLWVIVLAMILLQQHGRKNTDTEL